MGLRNYLIEGGSCSGKTSVCRELQRRGYHGVNGDTELAYQGEPFAGEPQAGQTHEHHLWNVEKVKAVAADHTMGATFFCGGSRNFGSFIEVFDAVFVLEVDADTLSRRLNARAEDEWGGKPDERELVERLHRTGEGLPRSGIAIDATAPLGRVVDEILRRCVADPGQSARPS